MIQTLEIDYEVYSVLSDAFGEASLKKKFKEILISGVERQLDKYNREILNSRKNMGSHLKNLKICGTQEK